MARKRMIDPNIWESEDFSKLSLLAKLVFIGMFSLADDEGRGRAKSAYLKSKIFPYEDGMRVADVDKTLQEIGSNMSVTLYSHDENFYYQLDNWKAWQKIDRPQLSRIPAPGKSDETGLSDDSTNDRRSIDECSTNDPDKPCPNKNRNKKRIEEKEDILSGAEASSASKQQPIISLVLNDHSFYPVYQPEIDSFSELYPAVDIMQELRNMSGWCTNNPKKRKTKAGINRFMNSWLAKKQDQGGNYGISDRNAAKGGAGQNAGTPPKPSPKYGNVL